MTKLQKDSLTPEQRTLRARMAAHAMHAMHDSRETTAHARSARWERYLAQVDPDGVLPEAERIRRAEHARQADMLRLSLASASARASRKRAQR